MGRNKVREERVYDDDDEFAEDVGPEPAAPGAQVKARASAPPTSPAAPGLVATSVAILAAVALSVAIYGTQKQLEGALLYDDKAAVLGSPVVQGEVPLSRVWVRDFWGKDDLSSKESHKSFRPLVTLTYRLNHIFVGNDPYWYHVFNVAVHALVSALVVPTTFAILGWRSDSIYVPAVAALLFAAHPIHVESVQNGVGRAELMMSFFYLAGFLVYTHCGIGRAACASRADVPVRLSSATLTSIAVVHACTLASLLCKETGVTLPILCAAWDVIVVVGVQPRHLLDYVRNRNGHYAWLWRVLPAALVRYALLAIGCVTLALWRKGLNGPDEPEFARKQNMPVFHPSPFFRTISIVWVWIEYMWGCFVPMTQSCDWSYPAISTVDSAGDVRLYIVLAYLGVWALLLWKHALKGWNESAVMTLVLALCPFFLASNVLFIVGTCKAERVAYLPSIGACIAIPLLLVQGGKCASKRSATARVAFPSLSWAIAAVVLAAFTTRCMYYADMWRTGVSLWEHAMVTQASRPAWMHANATTHSIGEYGLQLSWANRNAEAQVLLERQIRITEEERMAYLAGGSQRAWGAADDGSMDLGGWGPLALVYRINGDPFKALAAADRAIELFEIAREQGKENSKKRELGMIIAARALALWQVKPELSGPEMSKALAISNGQDIVVVKLAEQLYQAMERTGYKQPSVGQATPSPEMMAIQGLAQDSPELKAMLDKPKIQSVIREMAADKEALHKYAADAEVLAFARLVGELQKQRLQGGGGVAQAGGPSAVAARKQSADIPMSIDELEEWTGTAGSAQLHKIEAVRGSGNLPPELGPLPNYATGAPGDPLATHGQAQAAREEIKKVIDADGDNAHQQAATKAFSDAAGFANSGNVAAAIDKYCDALENFAKCSSARGCRIGVCDTVFIKHRVHGSLGDVSGATCTAQVGYQMLRAIMTSAQVRGDSEVAKYASGVAEMLAAAQQKIGPIAPEGLCTPPMLVCNRAVDMIAAFSER